MEERLNLREFQTRLAERLKSSASRDSEASKLGFLAGGRRWLIALDQVGEMVTVNRLARAPWTQPWFLGVAGIRGTIHGCTDLAAFIGVGSPETPEEIRLLLANTRFGAHAAFRIDQAFGLRDITSMTLAPLSDANAPWLLAKYADSEGNEWTEISLESLLADNRFLQVAAR